MMLQYFLELDRANMPSRFLNCLHCTTGLFNKPFLSLMITLRSSISSQANSSFDLIVATSSGFTLQICLIMVQPLCGCIISTVDMAPKSS